MKKPNQIVQWILLVALLPLASFALAVEQIAIGQVLMATGDANRIDASGNSRALNDKSPIFEGDTLATAAGTLLQVKMIDNALLILQPETVLHIQRYYYPEAGAAMAKDFAVRIDLIKGRVRSVTGDLGEANHDAFRLNTPIAAIGIRGTDFETTAIDDITRVRLNSGAIVFSPLGDDCLASALGPCATDSSLLLTEDLGSPVAEMRAADKTPRIIDLPHYEANGQGSAINGQSEGEQLNSENQADEVVDALQNQAEPVVEPEPEVQPQPEPEPVVEFTPAPEPENFVDKIHWGRWEDVTFVDAPTVDELVEAEKEILFKNDLFVLFRDSFLSLDKGQASFELQSAQAGIIDGDNITEVTFKDGNLAIDFDDRTFQTDLSFSSPEIDGLVLNASGTVDSAGLLRSNQGAMTVLGGLSANNQQAGYLFTHNLDGSRSLQGATQWQRP